MKFKRLPSQDYLNRILRYDPDTGFLFWRHREDHSKQWNKCFAGKRAGRVTGGYRRIGIDGKQYQAHRLIWVMVYGETPPEQIDHRNLCKDDNWLDNLRPASHGQNQANAPKRKKDDLPKGVHKLRSRYMAQISHLGKRRHIGVFDTVEAAAAAYADAARSHHGEFARTA